MRYLVILATFAITQGGVIKDTTEECNGITVNGVFHDIETIKEDLDRPYMLAVDYSTNTVYFSYSLKQDEEAFKSAKIELDTDEFKDIDVLNGFAQTVDQDKNEVYIGSNDGIYKYNHDTDEVQFFGQRGSDVWSIFYKDVLYYSEFPSQFLYTYINGTVNRFVDLEDTKVDSFVIDNVDNIFYTNSSGLFSQKKGSKDAVFYEEFENGAPRGMTTDQNGNVFVCLVNGIYAIDKQEKKLKKTVDINDCFGVAFDKNNHLIYSDSNSLVRLKPNKNKSC